MSFVPDELSDIFPLLGLPRDAVVLQAADRVWVFGETVPPVGPVDVRTRASSGTP
jgi:hypothetical protein